MLQKQILYKCEDDTNWHQENFRNINKLIRGAERYRKLYKEKKKLKSVGKIISSYEVYIEKAMHGFEELVEENGRVWVDYEFERKFYQAMKSIKKR